MNIAVFGAGFGDEGKGVVTDFLTKKYKSLNPMVVRFCGGHQVGHTVYNNDIRHVFSNFGSGTLNGTPTYWSKFCTIDPIGIFNEWNVLNKKGITPKLFIDKNCPVTTPFDKINNQKDITNLNNGTCGVGFGKTLQREEDHFSITALDILYPKILKIKLEQLKQHYYMTYDSLSLDDFFHCCEFIINNPNIEICDDSKLQRSVKIFEGSQGLLLDQHYGFFPNVTRSNTGSKNIKELIPVNLDQIFMVSRAYQTRHGNGPMTNTEIKHDIELSKDETNVSNKYQGDFRVSVLDLDLINYAIERDTIFDEIKQKRRATNVNLVITCLEHTQHLYQYTHKGKEYWIPDEDEFLNSIKDHLVIPANIYKCKNHIISKVEG